VDGWVVEVGGWMGGGRSEEAAREVTIKIRRRSCFVAVVGAEGRSRGRVREGWGGVGRGGRGRGRTKR
jgi:hypothetical protein